MTSTQTNEGQQGSYPMLPRPYRVTSTIEETADTVTLKMVAAHGDGTMAFRPGQFTMIYSYGVGEVPISISGDPSDERLLQHTVRRVGAVTNAICDLAPGDELGIRGPYGTGWPTDSALGNDVLVIAGGIGLAPLRPAVLDLLANRDQVGSLSLLYGARTPDDLLFVEDLHEWRSRFDLEAEVTVDRAAPGWFGDVGVVTTLLPRVAFEPADTMAMVCGPEIMMKIVARELSRLGVPEESIYVSIERNMKCAVGFCGHCQFGADFVCRSGPVMPYKLVAARMGIPEI